MGDCHWLRRYSSIYLDWEWLACCTLEATADQYTSFLHLSPPCHQNAYHCSYWCAAASRGLAEKQHETEFSSSVINCQIKVRWCSPAVAIKLSVTQEKICCAYCLPW